MTVRRLAACLFVLCVMAGCATSGGAGSSVNEPAVAGGQPPQALTAGPVSLGSTIASHPAGIVVGAPPSSDIERSVNATYTVPTGSFLASFEGVVARGVALGGYVVSSATQPDSAGRVVSGSVTLKVPAAGIAAFLNGMPSTFVASAIDFSAVDHTAQFIDVNARLTSGRARLAALDALLSKATSIADITTLEQDVETVQAEVNTDQGQLNVLNSSVQLSTATVQMSERGATVAAAPNPVSGGVGGGWDNAVHVTGVVLEGVLSALPLLLLAGVGLFIWWRVARRQPTRRQASAAK